MSVLKVGLRYFTPRTYLLYIAIPSATAQAQADRLMEILHAYLLQQGDCVEHVHVLEVWEAVRDLRGNRLEALGGYAGRFCGRVCDIFGGDDNTKDNAQRCLTTIWDNYSKYSGNHRAYYYLIKHGKTL